MPIPQKVTLRIRGTVPYESWNMLGTRILPKIRSGEALTSPWTCQCRSMLPWPRT